MRGFLSGQLSTACLQLLYRLSTGIISIDQHSIDVVYISMCGNAKLIKKKLRREILPVENHHDSEDCPVENIIITLEGYGLERRHVKWVGYTILSDNKLFIIYLHDFYGFSTAFIHLVYKLSTAFLQESGLRTEARNPQHQGYEKVISL